MAKRRRKLAFKPEHAEEAMVLRDLVLQTSGKLTDHECIERVVWLMKFSMSLHRRRFPKRHRRSPNWAYVDHGLLPVWGDGEHSFVCVFCQDNVATFANSGRRHLQTTVDKFRLHGWSCGLHYLMELGGF